MAHSSTELQPRMQASVSELFAVDDDPDEQDNTKKGAEKLQKVWWHYFVFFLCIVAVPLSTNGLHGPMSCVTYVPTKESMFFPQYCEGLKYVKGMFMPSFCWVPCSLGQRRGVFLSALIGTLLLQGFVLLANSGCESLLRLSYYVDLSDYIGKEGSKKSSQARPISKMLNPMAAAKGKVTNILQDKARSSGAQTPRLSKKAAMVSRMLLLFAALHMIENIIMTFSSNTVFFECAAVNNHPFNESQKEGHVEVLAGEIIRISLPPVIDYKVFFCQCTSIALMMVAWVLLVTKTTWLFFVKLSVNDQGQLNSYVMEGVEEVKGVMHWYTHPEARREKKELKNTGLMHLLKVKIEPHGPEYEARTFFDGRVYLKDETGSDGGYDVLLKFKPKSKGKQWVRWNSYRFWVQLSLFCATWSLHIAGGACWSCLKGISLGKKVSSFLVNNWLLLMGACGRHSTVGQYCNLASLCTGIAWVQQMLIFFCAEKRIKDDPRLTGTEHNDKQQLLLPLMDFRKHVSINAESFKAAGEELPKISCHVWVLPSVTADGSEDGFFDVSCDEDVSEVPVPKASGSKFGLGGGAHRPVGVAVKRDNKKNWEISKLPREVQLISRDIEIQKMWREDLTNRPGCNLPSVCIEFMSEPNKSEPCRQIVPPEFVAGSFHANLLLGPKVAWEKMSGFLATVGLILALLDIVWYKLWDSRDLTNCSDIDNKRNCIYVGNGINVVDQGAHPDWDSHELQFRDSVGVVAAGVGAILSFTSVVFIRFATKESTLWEALSDIFFIGCKLVSCGCSLINKVFRALCAELCATKPTEAEHPLLPRRGGTTSSQN